MNDQQLIDALRAIGNRPAEPHPAFAEQLWRDLPLRRRRAPVPIRRELLVAALLVLAGLAVALAVGSSLLQDRPLVVNASIEPSPTSAAGHPVYIPEGLQPRSAVADVETAALASIGAGEGGLVTAMAVLLPDVAFPGDGGAWTSRPVPVWGVQTFKSGGPLVVVFVVDGTLEVAGRAPGPPVVVTGSTPSPRPTWDPETRVELVSDRGRTIPATLIRLDAPGGSQVAWPPVALGDNLWLHPALADGGPVNLLRLDMTTGASTRFALGEAVSPAGIVAGRDRIWVESSGSVHEVDPVSGVVRRSLAIASFSGPLLAEDDEGLWFRTSVDEGASTRLGAAVLLDPETGATVRQVRFRETGSHPYTGFWEPPAFGSLWDVDRGTGVVHRIDRVTGADQATIAIPASDPEHCSDPRPITGVDGLPPSMVVDCLEATMVIDATANSLVRALPKESRALFGVQVPVFGRPIAAAGSLWESVPQGSAGVDVVTWWYPGGLMRLDPVTGEPLEVLTLNRTQASAVLPFLAGDSLWMSVDATTLLRITLADLAD